MIGTSEKRSPDSDENVQKIKVLIVDIEGTTTSISFVKETLFPYIRENLRVYVKTHLKENEFVDDLVLLKKQAESDKENGIEGFVPIPTSAENEEELCEAVCKNILWQMDLDRKTQALKQLQGHVMREGYLNGKLKGHVYDDVQPALKSWTHSGRQVYVYSSGSVAAQKLLFGFSEKGDLLEFFSGHFDTEMGPKVESSSYNNIAKQLKCKNNEILFLTDVPTEAKAAKEAGFEAILVSRPGNAPLSDEDCGKFRVIKSFDDIVFEASAKRTKLCVDKPTESLNEGKGPVENSNTDLPMEVDDGERKCDEVSQGEVGKPMDKSPSENGGSPLEKGETENSTSEIKISDPVAKEKETNEEEVDNRVESSTCKEVSDCLETKQSSEDSGKESMETDEVKVDSTTKNVSPLKAGDCVTEKKETENGAGDRGDEGGKHGFPGRDLKSSEVEREVKLDSSSSGDSKPSESCEVNLSSITSVDMSVSQGQKETKSKDKEKEDETSKCTPEKKKLESSDKSKTESPVAQENNEPNTKDVLVESVDETVNKTANPSSDEKSVEIPVQESSDPSPEGETDEKTGETTCDEKKVVSSIEEVPLPLPFLSNGEKDVQAKAVEVTGNEEASESIVPKTEETSEDKNKVESSDDKVVDTGAKQNDQLCVEGKVDSTLEVDVTQSDPMECDSGKKKSSIIEEKTVVSDSDRKTEKSKDENKTEKLEPDEKSQKESKNNFLESSSAANDLKPETCIKTDDSSKGRIEKSENAGEPLEVNGEGKMDAVDSDVPADEVEKPETETEGDNMEVTVSETKESSSSSNDGKLDGEHEKLKSKETENDTETVNDVSNVEKKSCENSNDEKASEDSKSDKADIADKEESKSNGIEERSKSTDIKVKTTADESESMEVVPSAES